MKNTFCPRLEFLFQHDVRAIALESSPVAVALRKHLSVKKDAIYAKSSAQLDEMWASGNEQKRRELLRSKKFLAMLNESHAYDILASPDMVKILYAEMEKNPMGVLPSSPRLSPQTLLRLMKEAIIANEPESKADGDLMEKIQKRVRTSAVFALSCNEFPSEHELDNFQYSSIPPQYAGSPALSLSNCPIESSICLLMRKHVWQQQAVLATYELQLRHGLWERVALKIAKDEIPLSLRDIITLCDYGDLENADPELVSALFETGHPLVRGKIIYTGLLNASQRDRAWQQGDVEVCRQLLKVPEFLYNLTEEQVRDIMALNDIHMLQILAVMTDCLYNKRFSAARLNPQTRDELLRFIIYHPDKDVQRLLSNNGVPQEIIEHLKQ